MDFKKFIIVAGLIAYSIPAMMGCAQKKADGTDDEDSTAPTTAPVSKVDLSASSTSQTKSVCFAITATAIGSDGSTVSADADATFTLSVTSGTGTFYTDSGCSSSTTSGTITQGSSTLTLYFKSTTIEAESVKATYASTDGTAWSGTIYGPNATAVQMASISGVATCKSPSVYYVSGNSTYPMPYASTIVLTQTSGATVTCYDTSNCTGNVLTSGSVTTIPVSANAIGPANFSCSQNTGNQTFVFNAAWSYTQNGIATTGTTSSLHYQNW